ncbi:MAG: membrane dipeptidase, partial [Planctomycetota bacterium]
NLLSDFLQPWIRRGDRATMEHVLDHIEHVCDVTGSTAHTGLGSDADGGFGADRLPAGIDALTDFRAITDGLVSRGWDAAACEGFRSGNWMRFWGW